MTFKTDKVSLGYLPTYLGIASQVGIAGRVCEVGVWKGGSLEMWQALFPAGVIVGVDHNRVATWPDGTFSVVASQDDEQLPDKLRDICDCFDLIVEDASHSGHLSRKTLNLLWPLVRPGGWYVLEDWQVGFDTWPGFDRSMLDLAESLLSKLTRPDGDVASITYRYGMAILRKRG
jgi:hypothetical protein